MIAVMLRIQKMILCDEVLRQCLRRTVRYESVHPVEGNNTEHDKIYQKESSVNIVEWVPETIKHHNQGALEYEACLRDRDHMCNNERNKTMPDTRCISQAQIPRRMFRAFRSRPSEEPCNPSSHRRSIFLHTI